jgi:hypothetical protein
MDKQAKLSLHGRLFAYLISSSAEMNATAKYLASDLEHASRVKHLNVQIFSAKYLITKVLIPDIVPSLSLRLLLLFISKGIHSLKLLMHLVRKV